MAKKATARMGKQRITIGDMSPEDQERFQGLMRSLAEAAQARAALVSALLDRLAAKKIVLQGKTPYESDDPQEPQNAS